VYANFHLCLFIKSRYRRRRQYQPDSLVEELKWRHFSIFKCIGINPENLSDFRKLNTKFLRFGDTFVFITNLRALLERVKAIEKEGAESDEARHSLMVLHLDRCFLL
jgi:hypothetical protein